MVKHVIFINRSNPQLALIDRINYEYLESWNSGSLLQSPATSGAQGSVVWRGGIGGVATFQRRRCRRSNIVTNPTDEAIQKRKTLAGGGRQPENGVTAMVGTPPGVGKHLALGVNAFFY